MTASEIIRLRRQCEELERAVRRAARSVISADVEADRDLEKIAPALEDDLESWRRRKLHVFGLLRFYHGIMTAKGRAPEASDYIRLRALMESPEYCELTSGRTVACHPVTVWRLDRIALRGELLRRITALTYEAETLDAADRWALVYRLDREKLWQRAAQLYEVTLPPSSKLELPIDPPAAARLLVRFWGWLDGSNKRHREHWRLRALAAWLWHVLDWGKISISLGLPPAWIWAINAADEVLMIRTHLKANDERIAAIPPLPSSGAVENWGWSGFAQAVAEARNATPEQYIRDRTLVAILTDVSQSQARAEVERKKRERADRKATAAAKAKAGGPRGVRG